MDGWARRQSRVESARVEYWRCLSLVSWGGCPQSVLLLRHWLWLLSWALGWAVSPGVSWNEASWAGFGAGTVRGCVMCTYVRRGRRDDGGNDAFGSRCGERIVLVVMIDDGKLR
ncbi:hypothetical protein BDP81DRAFT_417357 [Colletotrichum phormii]|uniref:Uncharacterized protein n=1 Tax=Colletotrichum phormii TaxID=359342 RepID=A0AAJ0A4Y8_9PEZI|nr:uncharacterized protein BDP81DRAFT_417357 [Colletotrichum phormii]KAK1655102.1 hypothetical protein BDP81DRAFT_417357 [Colletotrichum phormii]